MFDNGAEAVANVLLILFFLNKNCERQDLFHILACRVQTRSRTITISTENVV